MSRLGGAARSCRCKKSCKRCICNDFAANATDARNGAVGASGCNTQAVRSWREILTILVLIASLSVLAPAVSLASGGGNSAGDQQYIDPLGGGSTQSGSTTTHSSSPSTTPTPSSSSAPSTSPAPATSPSTAGASTTSTAGASTTSTTTQSSAVADPASAATLPRTGLDVWLVGAVGIALVASGLAVRRVLARR
jgi:hypothetical protein